MPTAADPASSSRRLPRRLGRAVGAVLTAGALGLAGVVLVPALLGFERYIITGGSMTGAYDRGSIVFDRVVAVGDLRVGDTITYTPPPGSGPSGLVTHRIARIGRRPDGALLFRTKGDANAAPDPWTFALSRGRQARVAFHVPYAGYTLAALGDRRVRMVLIGLPALVIAFGVFAGVWREAGERARAAAQAGAR